MSYTSHQEEIKVLERLKNGDATAFAEIYSRFAPGLVRYVFAKMDDLPKAQDVVHDIFAKFWDKRSELQIEVSLGPYLYKQALNRCLNEFRHQKVVQQHVVQNLSEFMRAAEKSADQHLLDKEIADTLRGHMEALAPKMRETLALRLELGYSNREIAHHLQVSEHTVATQIKRALRMLRTKMRYIPVVVFLAHWMSG